MPSRRIITNTSATYIRSIITAGLGLFSARWIFTGLGATDYGLFAVVGSIIMFITILNGVMAGSASRHFAFAIGRGDPDYVNRWFNTSLCIHLILPVVLIAIGWPISEYCIRHVLAVPADRIRSCLWVFRLSLIVAFVGMTSIPYLAMFSSKQNIAELAFWGTLQSVVSFVFAFILTKVSGDRLLFYAISGMIISLVFQAVQILRARYIFSECRIHYRYWFDKGRFKEIFSFASWTMIGALGSTLRDQGSAVLLNVYFGPKVNAAFGIANTVSSQTNQLGVAMIGAFSPEIMASEGRGDRSRMLTLAQQASKFGAILVLLFAIPLVVEMDYVLKLWLKTPPEYTSTFCQLIIATFILERLSTGYMLAFYAYGRIAAYQATLGSCLILTLPLAWLLLKLGSPPTSVAVAFVATMTAVTIGRILWARRLLNVPVWCWLRDVLLPVGTVTVATTAASLIPRCLLLPSYSRLALVISASVLTTIITAWFFALKNTERYAVKQAATLMCDKITVGK